MSVTTQDQNAFLVGLRRDREECDKLAAERETLVQEALKLSRDRILAPIIELGVIVIGGLGLTLRH